MCSSLLHIFPDEFQNDFWWEGIIVNVLPTFEKNVCCSFGTRLYIIC